MLTREQIDRLLSEGANVLSADGEKIGSIGQVYVDNDDGQPSWITVRTGLFGMSESFVPLEGARTEDNDIVVPYSKDQVKDAPRIDSGRALEPSEEDRLFQHYQLVGARTYTDATANTPDATARPGTDRTDARTDGTLTTASDTDDARAPAAGTDTATGATGYDTTAPATEDAQAPVAQRDTAGGDRSGAGTTGHGTTATATATATGYETTAPATEDAQAPVTQRDTAGGDRSGAGTTGHGTTAAGYATPAPPQTRPDTGADAEYDTPVPATEEARARAQAGPDLGVGQPATRPGRLRKYVTTENVTRTVPVQREEVRIDREPITDENREEVLSRPGSDDDREVILHEERLIVTKETVPVERVHIGTETVTEEVTINEEVRKEHLDAEGSEESRE